MENEAIDPFARDHLYKVPGLNEFLKQLITLSSGAIVLIATVMQLLGRESLMRGLLKVSIAGLLVSVICAIVCMVMLLSRQRYAGMATFPKWEETTLYLSLIISCLGLVVGLVSLGLFAIANV